MVTGVGVILGTAAYMSPEQAKGRPVDKRSDVWAFGCVLYEMLTALRPFTGDDVSETIASVLRSDPDWSALPADTPPAVRTLLRRCLQKNLHQRLPHIGVARIELDEREINPADTVTAGNRVPHVAVGNRERLAWAALVGVVVISAAVVGWALRPVPPPPEMRVEINTPPTNDPQSRSF
jgi:serine/threonine protein kinase